MIKNGQNCNEWFVYVLISGNNKRTYTGVTTNLAKRLRQHNGFIKGGAKATRANRPWKIGKFWSGFRSRSEAQIAEAKIKKLSGIDKLNWGKNK